MRGQVPLQLGQCGEVQPTFDTHVLLTLFMLQLMRTKLAGVSKASTTHTAAIGAEKVCVKNN